MKKQKLLASILVIAMVFSMGISTTAYAVGNPNTTLWVVQTNENGETYLQNTETGEKLLEAFRLDELGNHINIDLTEYAQILNQDSISQNQESSIAQGQSEANIIMRPDTITVTAYHFTQTTAYQTSGSAVKVTPSVTGPATITYGNSVTVSNSFSANFSLSYQMTTAIVGGTSFGWNTSASTNTSFSISYVIDTGKVGYIQFRPTMNATYGYIDEYIYADGILLSTSRVGYAYGFSPAKLSNGFADGVYERIQS